MVPNSALKKNGESSSRFRLDQLIIIIKLMKNTSVLLALAATAAVTNALPDLASYATKLAAFNQGMMQSMQQDPTNTYS